MDEGCGEDDLGIAVREGDMVELCILNQNVILDFRLFIRKMANLSLLSPRRKFVNQARKHNILFQRAERPSLLLRYFQIMH